TVQADGKILVMGESDIDGDYDFALVRYNTDGSLDTTFDSDGIVTTDFGNGDDYAYDIVTQSDGKILVVGQSSNGSNDDISLVRYNADGSLDTSFNLVTTLDGAPSFTKGGAAVVLDSNVVVSDAELDALNGGSGNYSGASVTLVRNGGANSDDVYSETGTLSALTESGNLLVGGTTIGTVTTNSGGTLVLTFNANATTALVNSALQQVAYSNSSDDPSASAQIDWSFDDGNTGGSQGTGGALQATGSTTVTITAVNDAIDIAVTGNTVLFTEDAGTTTSLFSSTIDTIEAADTITQLILTMANVESGDTLSFGATNIDLNTNGATVSGGFTYTVSSAGATPVVTITHAGTDDGTVNTMLNSLVFNNTTNNDPSTTARTVTLTSVTDSGSGTTADGTVATVNVAKADDAIDITVTGNTVLFTEDSGATTSLFSSTIDTIETTDTITQVILTMANVESGDTLSFGATDIDLNTNGATVAGGF
ncbi:MAG: hypothetical protein GY784_17565, partial [Gammaproteobacteria bacterium]|nr:hypothetical protein [Gammaproteobacteria bacterium]